MNGVHKRKYRFGAPKFYWRYESEISADFSVRTEAEEGYITRLRATHYNQLFEGKTTEKIHAIVFGAKS